MNYLRNHGFTIFLVCLGALPLSLLAFFVYQAYGSTSSLNQWDAACKKRGGIPVTSPGLALCIKRDAIIQVTK